MKILKPLIALITATFSLVCPAQSDYKYEKPTGADNFYHTYNASERQVSETAVDEHGHIDYAKISPILFEMPSYTYLETGKEIGKCMKMH